jgi:hypothetical protein
MLHEPSAPFKNGAEVRLEVTVTNTSDHNVRFARSPGIVPEEELNYFLEIRDAKGGEVALTQFFANLRAYPQSTWGSFTSRDLAPREWFEDDLVITKLYDLTQPGAYTITASRPLAESWKPLAAIWGQGGEHVVKSNTITIRIEK